jgi:ADP-heptose:LPS heptosyltransferase
MQSQHKRILVIRNDKIGDFMLAWPAFQLLKKQYPNANITALVPPYTQPLAELCPWIDDIIVDQPGARSLRDIFRLAKTIKLQHFDASISLFSQTGTAAALFLAGIKQRIGPATKLAQVFLNRTLKQRRSQSAKPEYVYNCDLIEFFVRLQGDQCTVEATPPYLTFAHDQVQNKRQQFMSEHHLTDDQRLIIIHPGTGGSAVNISLDQYTRLAEILSASVNACFIITAGPGEIDYAKQLSHKMQHTRHVVYESTHGIIDFCQFIDTCDLFISGSTGPLHIAGALNKNTVAFFPSRQSATSLRWQTLNQQDRRLAFSPGKDKHEQDMASIDPERVATEILKQFFTH